jgi:hypothetical protein
MAENELLEYPRGQIGFGSGNLKQCTNAKFSLNRNAKLKHTIAKSPAGICYGNTELSGTFEFEIDETGLERDVLTDLKKGTRRQFRFKDSASTDEISGAFTSFDKEIPTDDAVKVTVGFVGKLID